MKTRSVPRILAVIVLALTLAAATAPAAWAVPGAGSGSHAPVWDLGSVFTWLQGLASGWLGGGAEGEEGPQSVTGKAGHALEPDGRDVKISVSGDSPQRPLPEGSPAV